MQLWTEYEGRTIEGTWTLGKLLRSEGRNGFFSTADTAGTPAVIRLTEAHYDEDELLKRWQQVAGMHQSNLIEIERFGQTDFDGVAITYALMEANDANLGDVLRERPLTVAEATQVARAVHGALTALHTSGLVHEHIAPDNVLAVGETVKLRSDCVRECVADTEFNTPEGCARLRRRDIHDFGILLLQCLTLEKTYNPGLNLPDVFRRLIPQMIAGTWTLEQIGQMLTPPTSPKAIPPAAVAPAGATRPQPAASRRTAPTEAPAQGRLPLDAAPAAVEPALRSRRSPIAAEDSTGFKLRPMLLAGVAIAIVCIFVIWHFVSAKPAPAASPEAAAPAVAASAAAAPQPSPQPVARLAAAPASPPVASATHTPGWYVIAFTYNHQGQAQTKADRLNDRHQGFHAVVFSPRGAAPYLVSLGGPMSQADAKALQQRARRSGFPSDTYIRNYR